MLLVSLFASSVSAWIPYTITTTTSGSGSGTVQHAETGFFGRGRLLTVSMGGIVPGSYATIAAAFAVAQTNDTVFVYNGTYTANSQGIGADNISFIGENKSNTFLKRSILGVGAASVLDFTGGRNVNISGFTIENTIAFTNYGIQSAGGSDGATISDCIFRNFSSAAITLYDGVNNVTICGNTFYNCNFTCIAIERVATVFNCWYINIIDNTFNGTTTVFGKYMYGIYINNSYFCKISNNRLSSFRGACILLGHTNSNIEMSSNQILDYYILGISIAGGTTFSIVKSNVFKSTYFASAVYIVQSDNSLVDSNTFDTVLGGTIVSLSDSTIISNNLFTNIFSAPGNTGVAINLGVCQFSIVSGNTFVNITGWGLYLQDTTTLTDVNTNNFINITLDTLNNELTFSNSYTLNFYQNYTGGGVYNIYNDAHTIITATDGAPVSSAYEYVFLNITGTKGLGSGYIDVTDGPYYVGDYIILWANVSFNCYFWQWEGDLSSYIDIEILLMDDNKTVSANFGWYDWYYYSEMWANGSSSRSRFIKWSGDLTGSTTPDWLLVDSDKTVDAEFGLAPVVNITVRYENETDGMNGLVPLNLPFTGVHKFIIYYGNFTDTVTWNNLSGTGCISTSTVPSGDLSDKNESGFFRINITRYADPLYMELRWNDTNDALSFGQLNYCTRQQVWISGKENYTFYIRTDCPVYAESTLFFNGSLFKYKMSFSDETGEFIYPNHPYIEVFSYNSSGVYQIIHSEYMDASGRIYPWLVYAEKYFLGAYSDKLDIFRLGTFYASSTEDQGDIRIPYQTTITYNIYDLITIKYSWYNDGFWVSYLDTTGSTISTEFTVYNFTTLEVEHVEPTLYQSSKTYYYDTAMGCNLNHSYYFRINTTLSWLTSEFYAGNYTTGLIPIYHSHLSISNITIDNILISIFGGSPVYDYNDPTIFVPWTYLLISIGAFVVLLTFGRLNAFIGGVATGGFLLLAGAGITVGGEYIGNIALFHADYSFWTGPSIFVIGVFIIAISIIGLLGGVENR
jgi:hypothetical protein